MYIISGFMKLTCPEAMAIRWHMGFSGWEDKPPGGPGPSSTPGLRPSRWPTWRPPIFWSARTGSPLRRQALKPERRRRYFETQAPE